MKKKREDCFESFKFLFTETNKALLWIACIVLFPISGFAETVNQVSIRKNNASLEEVIWELKRSTRMTFMYSDEDIAVVKGINLNENNSTVDAVLAKCLQGTNLEYLTDKEEVIIRTAPELQ